MSKQHSSGLTHITIFGNRNAGKSSLFNAILNQDYSIVDDTMGTTTDPVTKRIELLPYGPVVLTDTAGYDDDGILGNKRVEKTRKMIAKTDFAIILIDASSSDFSLDVEEDFKKFDIPFVKVFNKVELLTSEEVRKLKEEFDDCLFVSANNMESVIDFKKDLVSILNTKTIKSIVGSLLEPGSNVVLVVPIDSEAPKGRIILPQVQTIRDLLDYNINAIVTNEINLKQVLDSTKVDLVVTDSQAFNEVSKIVPEDIYLTSFSILFANHKSSINDYTLIPSDNIKRVLICESCTHNIGHEDIGFYKIPKLLKKRYGEDITIKHVMGNDFESNLSDFDLIIHCGNCMLNDSVIKYRIKLANEAGVEFTNYGLYLAYEAGIIDRSIKFLVDKGIYKS